MKWAPKSYVETIIPLITAYALIGHGVFHYPAGKPRIRFSIFYTIIFFIGFAILLHYTINHLAGSTYDSVEAKLFFYMVYWHTIIMNCTAALSWYHYKKSGRVVQKMTAIDQTLKELGGDCCYLHCYRFNVAALVFQLFLGGLINGVDVIWMKSDMSYLQMIWFNFVTHHPFHVSSYALLNFSMAIRQIIHRFTETNKILEKITTEGPATVSFFQQKQSQVSEADVNALGGLVSRNDSSKYLVQIIKQVHLELCSISRDLNKVFGVQVLLQIAEYFLLMTGLIYDLYLNCMITGQPDRDLRIGAILFWLTIHFAKVGALNYVCGKAVSEANRTSEIIHISSTMYEDQEFKDEISQFALQMIQDPLSFSPAGFFTLNNCFFKAMLGSITTYTVILIEMNVVSKL